VSPDPQKPCLHCQLWKVLKKRLPIGKDRMHILSHDDALEALGAVAELAGELLAGVDAPDRQATFDMIMQTITIAHETVRGDGPSTKRASAQ